MTTHMFNADEIRSLLAELGAELDHHGIAGEMYLVGGAAIVLAYDGREATRDLDAIFVPKTEIYEAAARIASRRGIETDWLNDAVKGLLPGPDPQAVTVFTCPGLSVSAGSPRHLLAMKVASARVDRDVDDIRFLAEKCGLTTSREVIGAATEVWGPGAIRLTPKSSFLVQEIFGPLDSESE